MALSTYLKPKVLDHILGKGTADFTPPASLFVSLHSADPGLTGANELSGNGYVRVAVTFGVAASGTKSNSGSVVFGPAAGSNWAAATHFGVWDSSSAGNLLYYGALDTSRTNLVGGTLTYAVGDLDVTVSGASAYLRDEILDHVLGKGSTNWSSPTTLAISLHSADPSTTGASELSGNAYARQAVTFGAASAGSKKNSTAPAFGPASPSAWTAATHIGIWDATSAGNFLLGIDLNPDKTVLAGGTLTFAVDGIDATVS